MLNVTISICRKATQKSSELIENIVKHVYGVHETRIDAFWVGIFKTHKRTSDNCWHRLDEQTSCSNYILILLRLMSVTMRNAVRGRRWLLCEFEKIDGKTNFPRYEMNNLVGRLQRWCERRLWQNERCSNTFYQRCSMINERKWWHTAAANEQKHQPSVCGANGENGGQNKTHRTIFQKRRRILNANSNS